MERSRRQLREDSQFLQRLSTRKRLLWCASRENSSKRLQQRSGSSPACRRGHQIRSPRPPWRQDAPPHSAPPLPLPRRCDRSSPDRTGPLLTARDEPSPPDRVPVVLKLNPYQPTWEPLIADFQLPIADLRGTKISIGNWQSAIDNHLALSLLGSRVP